MCNGTLGRSTSTCFQLPLARVDSHDTVLCLTIRRELTTRMLLHYFNARNPIARPAKPIESHMFNLISLSRRSVFAHTQRNYTPISLRLRGDSGHLQEVLPVVPMIPRVSPGFSTQNVYLLHRPRWLIRGRFVQTTYRDSLKPFVPLQ